jgi:major membrane immunogen (membrane-anchored lipoprotein)
MSTLHPVAYPHGMKNRITAIAMATSAVMLAVLLIGCDRQVSSDKTSTTSSDGTVKSKEKTVTQSSDGTVTKTEESKKTSPPEKP